MVDGPDVVHLVGAKAVVAFGKSSPNGLCVRQRQTECDGGRDVTGRSGVIVSRTAPVHEVQLEI